MAGEAKLVHRPERDDWVVYLAGGGAEFIYDPSAAGQLLVRTERDPGKREPFLVLPDFAYRALEEAILLRSEGRLAERGTLADALDDTRDVRDRLLGIVERLID